VTESGQMYLAIRKQECLLYWEKEENSIFLGKKSSPREIVKYPGDDREHFHLVKES
jgi:hypothetical protein